MIAGCDLEFCFGYLTDGGVATEFSAVARTVWMAAACAMLAHAGGSTVWVFSTTLLQLHTEDRFRGRVFAADLGLSMLTIAAGAYFCGRFMDWGVSARTVATGTGMIMLAPAALWGLAMRGAMKKSEAEASNLDNSNLAG